jgi:hypothetical protein
MRYKSKGMINVSVTFGSSFAFLPEIREISMVPQATKFIMFFHTVITKGNSGRRMLFRKEVKGRAVHRINRTRVGAKVFFYFREKIREITREQKCLRTLLNFLDSFKYISVKL